MKLPRMFIDSESSLEDKTFRNIRNIEVIDRKLFYYETFGYVH